MLLAAFRLHSSRRTKSLTSLIPSAAKLLLSHTSPSSSSSSSAREVPSHVEGEEESRPFHESARVSVGTTSTGNATADLCRSISKLSKDESVVSALRGWMGQGFPVLRVDVSRTMYRLRKLNKNKRALEVMEWVVRERPYKLKELDYSYLLEFTVKLHGIPHGEKLFSRIPPEFQNDYLYNNLVLSCLYKGKIRLALDYMRKMRGLGFSISPLAFNRLILLHSQPGRRKRIPKILTQMKADGVGPLPSTYNMLLKIEASEHNIEGLMIVFNKMKQTNVQADEITYCIVATAHAVARLYSACEMYIRAVEECKTGCNWSTLDVLLTLYGYVGKEKDLQMTWRIIESLPRVRTKSYMLAIEAFGKVNDVERAEELWLQMKSKKQLKLTEQFNSLLSVYARHGHVQRASKLFREMLSTKCNPNAITYHSLALSCLKAGLVKEGLKTLEMLDDQIVCKKIRKSTPWLETTLSITEILIEKGEIDLANSLFRELKESGYTRYTFVHNALLKSYVKAEVYVPDYLRNMIIGGARPDGETYSLVRLLEQFKT